MKNYDNQFEIAEKKLNDAEKKLNDAKVEEDKLKGAGQPQNIQQYVYLCICFFYLILTCSFFSLMIVINGCYHQLHTPPPPCLFVQLDVELFLFTDIYYSIYSPIRTKGEETSKDLNLVKSSPYYGI